MIIHNQLVFTPVKITLGQTVCEKEEDNNANVKLCRNFARELEQAGHCVYWYNILKKVLLSEKMLNCYETFREYTNLHNGIQNVSQVTIG